MDRHAHRAAVAPVVEDVEPDRETAAVRAPSFARIPASVIVSETLAVVELGRPDDAALGRIDVPVPVLREPRALGARRGARAASSRPRARSRCGRSARRSARVRRPRPSATPSSSCDQRAAASAPTRVRAASPRRSTSSTPSPRVVSKSGRYERSTTSICSPSIEPAARAARARVRARLVRSSAESGVVHRGRTIAIVRGWPTIPTAREPRFPGADPTSFASSASPSSESATSRGCPTPSRSCSRTCCATPAASTCSEARRRGARALARARARRGTSRAVPAGARRAAGLHRRARRRRPRRDARRDGARGRRRRRASIRWCPATS